MAEAPTGFELRDQHARIHHAEFLTGEILDGIKRLVRGEALAPVRPDGDGVDADFVESGQNGLTEGACAQCVRRFAIGGVDEGHVEN